jgi:hypothetical protein
MVVLLTCAVVGYAPGVLSLRRHNRSAAPHTSARRSLGDYFSPWVWIIPLVTSGLSAILLLVASAGAHPVMLHWFGEQVSIHGTTAGALISAVIVLPVGLSLILSAAAARSPNILTSTDVQATQQANDDLRASVSATLVFFAWMNAVFPGDRMSSIYSSLAVPAPNGVLGALSTIILILQALFAIGLIPIILLGILMSSGRMGGRLTGWPWRRSNRREQPAIGE